MSSVIITLQSPHLQRAIDLELPGEVPLNNLLPELVRVLQLPDTDGTGQPVVYQLVHQAGGRPLAETMSLLAAGVVTGDVLSLATTVAQIDAVQEVASGAHASASALLRSTSGMVVALDNYGKPELTVGRYDDRTDKSPDIDLSGEPAGNTVSRSQALLRKQGDQWMLVSLSTTNPARIGETVLAPHQERPLKPGDVITFGDVRLIFETSTWDTRHLGGL